MKIVVLDRDGVINYDRPDYVKSVAEWTPIPGSLKAMGDLTRAGYEIAVATNQSGIGRGLYSMDDVNKIHEKLRQAASDYGARISGFYICPHSPTAGCTCRKPNAELLEKIACANGVSANDLTVIGDSYRDILAAESAGARGILVLTGHGKRDLQFVRKLGMRPEVYQDLQAAVSSLSRPYSGAELWLRSLVFNVSYTMAICGFSVLLLCMPVGSKWPRLVGHLCGRTIFKLMKWIIRLDLHVTGMGHIPDEGAYVFLWKHQSTWETFTPLLLSRKVAYVVKRELFWIPLFGWALKRFGAIGIDRGSRRKAVASILVQGKGFLSKGYGVVIYPEGHRMPPGTTKRYGISAALLAKQESVPIVPVAHNAGDFWPRKGFIKRPGTVRVVIGKMFDPNQLEVTEINRKIQNWVEGTMAQISVGYLERKQ